MKESIATISSFLKPTLIALITRSAIIAVVGMTETRPCYVITKEKNWLDECKANSHTYKGDRDGQCI